MFRLTDLHAVKVFRRQELVADRIDDDHDHVIAISEICEAECRAYELAEADEYLSRFVPRDFKRVKPVDVVDGSGQSIADSYVLASAYQMELIPGRSVKSTDPAVDGLFPEISLVLERMRAVGIDYVLDSSVFVPGTQDRFTLIDFAVHDVAADLMFLLSTNGQLPERLRTKLSPRNAG